MSAAAAWTALAALWAGCLHSGPWPLAAVGTAAIAVAGGTRGRARRATAARLLLVAAGMFLVGSGLAGGRVALVDRGALARLAADGGRGPIVATVVTDARATDFGAWLVVRASSLDGTSVRERALLSLPDIRAVPAVGTRVAFTATARPLGRSGFDAYVRRLHAGVALTPVVAPRVVSPPGWLLRGTALVRARVRDAARRHLHGDAAALLAGLVTGDTTGLSQTTRQQLTAAGLSHLVAVSGSNVALVTAGALGVAAACGLGARGRRRVALAAVAWFSGLVGGEPSVLRASVMAAIVLGAQATGRGADPRHTLATAATLLLLVDPFLAGQLGFALSVLATGGVLVVAPALARRVPGPRPVALLIGASVGAQVGVAPVLVAVEGAVPLAALPANLVAVPAAAVASAVGVVAALVAQLSTAVAGWLSIAAGPALAVVLAAGRHFADGPQLRPADVLSPVAVGLLLAEVARRRAPRVALATVVVTVVAGLAPWWRPAAPVTSLTLTALDVGQGDALLVESPGAGDAEPARMLVDGGPEPREALRLLRARGVRRLDAVVVSHPHADHTDGLVAVLASMPVGALLVGPAPVPAGGRDASGGEVVAVARERGVPIAAVTAGQRFDLGAATVDVLSPPADGSLGEEANDNSVVLRVADANGALLLTGDAEEAAQQWLLRRPELVRADVVKIPHHGGATNAAGFIDAVGAHTAVIAVGADNDYGHPHPDVLADLAGAKVLRTDTDGTVSISVEARPP